MNVERIIALADLIEKQPHTSRDDASGFNMVNWHHTCGTPSCIAGWAVAMLRGDTLGTKKIPLGAGNDAADYLGLTNRQSTDLFYPQLDDWEGITPEDAAHTLRKLAHTGEVEWSVS